MIRLVYLFITIVLISCNKKDSIENPKEIYYKNGRLKERHYYNDNNKKDSTFYYHNTKENNEMVKAIHLNDSLVKIYNYDNSSNLVVEGTLSNDKEVGKWKFLRKESDSIVEYVMIDNKTYQNQSWILSKSGDTLNTRGNYYKIIADERLFRDEPVIVLNVMLVEPLWSYDSEMEVLIPDNEIEINNNFSNLDKIKWDTIPSFKNSGLLTDNYPENAPINHIAEFGYQFENKGLKKLRGIIIEYAYNQKGNRVERKLYFEKEIFIK